MGGQIATHNFAGYVCHPDTGARPIQGIVWRTGGAAFKYLFDSLDGKESLFELRSDPAERVNLMATAIRVW